MTRRILDVDLDNLSRVPAESLEAVFWELEAEGPPVDARFQKEEWFSSTLLEWGTCGKILLEEERSVGFVQYAPPSLFPRLADYRCGECSEDAVYLAYCYVVPGRRNRGLGTEMVRAAARDLVDRGFRAMEALGDREWTGGWVLPVPFLARNRFSVIREDARFPLLRLDLRMTVRLEERVTVAAVPVPESGAA